MAQSIDVMGAEQTEAEVCRRLESVRLMKNISQQDLAKKAGVSRRTISRLENGKGVSFNTLIRVMRALGLTSHLDALVPSVEIRPIERVKQKRERKKASSPRKNASAGETAWKWGDE
jgi:transcriptional regulator with XRE-family HTH domain